MMNTKINFLAITAVGIVVASVGVFIWYSSYVKPEFEQRDDKISSLENQIQDLVSENQSTQNVVDDSGIDDLPIFTFEPSGKFSPEEKAEIEKKLINPYFDYYNEKQLSAVTMNIESGDDTWSVFVTNLDGSYDSFLYGNTEQSEQSWWNPQCFTACEFSNTFRATYPEVVSASNGL